MLYNVNKGLSNKFEKIEYLHKKGKIIFTIREKYHHKSFIHVVLIITMLCILL